MRSSSGCTGRSAALIAAMIGRAALDQLVGPRRVDRDARPTPRRRSRRSCRRRPCRRRPRRCPSTSTARSRACRNDGHVAQRHAPGAAVLRRRPAPRPARPGVSSRTTVSGSVTATIPVSTSTVATPIVPCPHIGRQPETSMNRTPQSASGARRRLEDRARHRAVAARLAHQQQPQVVHVRHEVQLALEHRRAGDRADAAGDDARRHALRVRVDGGEVARRPHAAATAGAAAPRARRRSSSCSAAVEREPRRAHAAAGAGPTASIARLEVLHELRRHVEARERQQPPVDRARRGRARRRGSARRARRTRPARRRRRPRPSPSRRRRSPRAPSRRRRRGPRGPARRR